jgi:hypothetical protein
MPELEERIAVLEANQVHMRDKLNEMSSKVDEMHELLLQAKGAKWAILGVASLAGFLAGKFGTFTSLFKM